MYNAETHRIHELSCMSDAVLRSDHRAVAELGEEMARALVDERLAACVNVLPPMMSIYRWKGDVQRDTERQLVIKTSARAWTRCRRASVNCTRTSSRRSSSCLSRAASPPISPGSDDRSRSLHPVL